MRNLIIHLFFLLKLYAVLGDHHDITTMYKFNVYEQADQSGEVSRTYLDSCAVTVHPQGDAIGLPYMRMRNNKTYDAEIIYPLASSTIPTVSAPFSSSQWTMGDEMGPLIGKPIPGDDYLADGLFKATKKTEEKMFASLIDNAVTIHESNNAQYYSNTDTYIIFGSQEMSEINKKKNMFLVVQQRIGNRKGFTFVLKQLRGSDITFKVSIGNTLEVCLVTKECLIYVYHSNEENQINIIIKLETDLVIYDVIGNEVIRIDIKMGDFTTLAHKTSFEYSYRYTGVAYKIVKPKLNNSLTDDALIMSPWLQIKNGSSLFINYYRKLNSKIMTYIDKEGDIPPKELEIEEKNIITLQPNPNSDTDVDEMVLVKVNIRFPQDWTQEKKIKIRAEKHAYITDIWEGGDQELYRIQELQQCSKLNITDTYLVALKEKNITHKITNTNCLNGGRLDTLDNICICPPGFTGDYCEIACGRNSFGRFCSKLCSYDDIECKAVILCTPSYGCSCAPGYHGDQCLQECAEGTYGADCQESCGQCKGGCDKYTGECKRECDSPYLIWPSCKSPHSYWKGSPVTLDSDYTSIKLGLNFTASNIMKSYDNTQFFLIQYRENAEIHWHNSSYQKFSPDMTNYLVYNLKPGRWYYFRVLLVDQTLHTNDPQYSKISSGGTKCDVSEINNNLNVTEVSNSSVSLVWNNETMISQKDNECPFSSYILEITNHQYNLTETRKIFNIYRNKIIIKSLSPDKTYEIKLKKSTIYGESSTISNVTVLTDSKTDDMLRIAGIVTNIESSKVQLEWFKNPLNKPYYIKYKLLRRLSCDKDEIVKSSLQVVSTSCTNYTLSLEPNAQYSIFITMNQNQMTDSKSFTIITGGKLPSVSPTLLKYKFRVTNESVQLYWTDPPAICNQMNGFFQKYRVELFDSHDNIINASDVYSKNIDFTGLNPKTNYKVRIMYVNHIGYNLQNYLEHIFSTKATSFLIAQDLKAYKASAHLIGLRWKMPDTNSTITRINVNLQSQTEKKSFNITDLHELMCKAWPSYACYTLVNLKQNTKYIVSIDIFNEEFPEGGSVKSIQVVTRETMPSTVGDIKVENIYKSNLTISWRIPYLLNGILRKFQIDVEHLSSSDETLCCQSVSTINYVVKEEQEIYSHVIENIQSASSYQVTIRAFTRRLGQEASKIIDIPPSLIPVKRLPLVLINDEKVVWQDKTNVNGSTELNELLSDLLVIVESNEKTDNNNDTLELSEIKTELDRSINSSNWWIAHVCSVNKDCQVHIGTEEESDSVYGRVINKPLTEGHNYTIVLAQVNKYLSARSYTVVKSVTVLTKRISVTTEASKTEEAILLTESNNEADTVKEKDYEELKTDDILLTENLDANGEETYTEEPLADY